MPPARPVQLVGALQVGEPVADQATAEAADDDGDEGQDAGAGGRQRRRGVVGRADVGGTIHDAAQRREPPEVGATRGPPRSVTARDRRGLARVPHLRPGRVGQAPRQHAAVARRPQDLDALRGLNERLDLDEVTRRLPAAVAAAEPARGGHAGAPAARPTRSSGGRSSGCRSSSASGGSVAVGKSTTARVLQALLARWPDHPSVDLVTTDGFLRPNRVLEERGIMDRKGFPESYDVRRLIQFLEEVKRGEPEVRAPRVLARRLRHRRGRGAGAARARHRDPRGAQRAADGRPVRATTPASSPTGSTSRSTSTRTRPTSSSWYVERFFALRETAFNDETSFFRHFAALSDEELEAQARAIWASINRPNLRRTSCRAGRGPTSCSTRAPTTTCVASACACAENMRG